MSDMISVASGLMGALITCGLGLYALRRGWAMLQIPTDVAPGPLELVAIALVRIVQGEAAVTRKKAELMKPDRIRRSGYFALIAGGGLLAGGCLQLVGWIGKIVGL
jgi:hypothetical protein